MIWTFFFLFSAEQLWSRRRNSFLEELHTGWMEGSKLYSLRVAPTWIGREWTFISTGSAAYLVLNFIPLQHWLNSNKIFFKQIFFFLLNQQKLCFRLRAFSFLSFQKEEMLQRKGKGISKWFELPQFDDDPNKSFMEKWKEHVKRRHDAQGPAKFAQVCTGVMVALDLRWVIRRKFW